MKLLRAIQKLIIRLFSPDLFIAPGADSHQWANKTEMFQRLSSHHV